MTAYSYYYQKQFTCDPFSGVSRHIYYAIVEGRS